MKLCTYLRWRAGYGVRWSSPEALDEAFSLATTPFTCLQTCQPWGPDDDAVVPERCQPDRHCFELSPRDPGTKALV